MEIKIIPYTTYLEKEVLPLYQSVGWENYTNDPEKLHQSFEHSLIILGAYSQDRLIGILRAVGDGYSILYIQDILVIPEFQHQGVGSALYEELFKRYPQVYQTALMTDAEMRNKAFYEKLGFKEVPTISCTAFVKFKK